MSASNERFCATAAVPLQTILCEIARLSPAASLVKPPLVKTAGTMNADRHCEAQSAKAIYMTNFINSSFPPYQIVAIIEKK